MSSRKSLDSMGVRNFSEMTPEDSWEPWDLPNRILEHNGELAIPPDPSIDILVRSDLCGLLYPGRTHDLHGPPESGLSWIAQLAVKDALMLGRRAVFLDYEDAGPEEIVDRLGRLGVPLERILDLLLYLQPTGPPVGAHWEKLVYDTYGVVVIDAANGALAEMERDPNSNADVTAWAKATVLPFAENGSPVVLVDHTGLAGTGRVLGATAKKASISGASYRVTACDPLVPGKVGVIDMHVVKDRPGVVRRSSGPRRSDGSQHAARITFDATDEQRIRSAVEPPPAAASASGTAGRIDAAAGHTDALRERISLIVERSSVPLSQNVLAKAAGGDRTDALSHIRQLIEAGYISTTPGANRAVLHRSVRAFRSAESERMK